MSCLLQSYKVRLQIFTTVCCEKKKKTEVTGLKEGQKEKFADTAF